MTLNNFLLKHTQVGELCVIRDAGYIIATVFIDAEDLFRIHDSIIKREVLSNEWGHLLTTTKCGNSFKVPCHYIDI